jgi:putative ABC transport system permease protein
VALVAVDLRKPELTGPFRVLSGRAPAGVDEVAVTQELAELGVDVGSSIELDVGRRTVTGVVQQPDSMYRSRAVLGLDDAVGLPEPADGQAGTSVHYWVTGPAVEWADVRRLNTLGFLVLSRAVVLDPPPDDQVPGSVSETSDAAVTAAILALIATMAVLEVTLLAGPAFAVGARRQRRSLALLAATGGEPAHVRKVVLSQGLLVGLVAAAVGVPLGIGIAAAVRAVLTRYDWRPGPFEVSLRDVLLIALLGAGVAVLAALAPAWVMARQPIVAALQGRRVTSAGAGRPALVGLLLMGVGLVITLASLRSYGFTFGGNRELGVAAGAIPTVLGAVLLAPAALALAGRGAARLPLALRFATRDADRQRGRTAPAVAAIAATVAGIIALGIAASSDAEENRRTYLPNGPAGVAVITDYGELTDWEAVAAVATRTLPEEPVTVVRGLAPSGAWQPDAETHEEVQVCRRGERLSYGRCSELQQDSYSSFLGSDVLVGTQALDALAPHLDPALVSQARAVLRSGGVLVGSTSSEPVSEVTLRLTRFSTGTDGGRPEVLRSIDVPALRLPTAGSSAGVRAVIPEELADELGGARTVAVAVGDRLTRSQEAALDSSIERVDDGLVVNVERGYEDRGDRTVLLILSVVAGLVVLGGTLAATSLALSEARPDLSTLGQVGARPGTRRAVAGGYAFVLALVGAGLGVLAGLIPGVAAALALTSSSYGGGWVVNAGVADHLVEQPRFYLDIPWWLLALVLVLLPLVAAGVAAAATRSRLDGPTRALA